MPIPNVHTRGFIEILTNSVGFSATFSFFVTVDYIVSDEYNHDVWINIDRIPFSLDSRALHVQSGRVPCEYVFNRH